MKVKIECTKDEFADIVRACVYNNIYGNCDECVFAPYCKKDDVPCITKFAVVELKGKANGNKGK